VFCQDSTGTSIFVYVERAGPQAMADPASALTIILIAVFVASLVFGLLFLVGARRQTVKSREEEEPREKPAPNVHREQAGVTVLASDTMGAVIGRIFRSLDNAINLFFSGLIFLYKWAFNYNGRPAAPSATTAVGEDARTRIATPPTPEPVSRPVTPPWTEPVSLPAQPALTITTIPAILAPPMAPLLQPPSPVPALPQYTPVAPASAQTQPQPRPGGRPYGLQAIIDIMGQGIEIALTGMSDGIIFIFEGFINLFKWIFRIDR